ncbi:MAG TPA: SIMPL domain-containing protein [Bryobacteraceae bacterium]|nr:SIMPL domain-containing protein [Bryobacteraceae bacterium]
MTPSTVRAQTQAQGMEGIAVVGEAVRRVAPESTQFLIEVSAAAHTPAQALRDHQTKATQITQAVATLGSQKADVQTISMNVVNTFAPLMQTLPAYAAPPQIGVALGGLQPELQFGTYQARSLQRVTVREPARVGEVAEAVTKAGATLIGGFSYHAADEAAARWAALEAAGRDARSKAEALATAAGREIAEPISIFEDVVASNGAYAVLRAQAPLAFGPGSPAIAGELEYYARVTASFRFVPPGGRVAAETR